MIILIGTPLAEASKEEFKQAYRREKDPKAVKRIAAVNMAYYNREGTHHAAGSLMQCPNRVLTWVRRFEEEQRTINPTHRYNSRQVVPST